MYGFNEYLNLVFVNGNLGNGYRLQFCPVYKCITTLSLRCFIKVLRAKVSLSFANVQTGSFARKTTHTYIEKPTWFNNNIHSQ